MALHELEVPSNAIDVAINADGSLIAVLHQEGVALFQWMSVAASARPPTLTGRVTFENTGPSTGIHQQISFAEKDEILVLLHEVLGSLVKRYGFDDDTGRMEELSSDPGPNSTISNLSSYYQEKGTLPFIQVKSGTLHSLAFGERSLSHCNFPSYLSWFEIVPYSDDYIAFGMSNSGHLYANSRLLVKNCTSFLVTPAHLIFTTTTHLLKFIHITGVHGMSLSPTSMHIADSD